MNKAFTLMELLIVIALLGLISIAAVYFFNPIAQIKKTRDTTRKNDLAMIKRAVEDFYNDTGRYPKAAEICYDNLEARTDSYGRLARSCHICSEKMSYPYANFQSIPSLRGKSICNPTSNKSESTDDYLYDYDNVNQPLNNSISWARVYVDLQYLEDHSIAEVECTAGCGPAPFFPYNYGITTNNVDLERKTSLKCGQVALYQFDNNNICNLCRGGEGDMNCSPTKPVYINNSCSASCTL